jgi:hypothetical protein
MVEIPAERLQAGPDRVTAPNVTRRGDEVITGRAGAASPPAGTKR